MPPDQFEQFQRFPGFFNLVFRVTRLEQQVNVLERTVDQLNRIVNQVEREVDEINRRLARCCPRF